MDNFRKAHKMNRIKSTRLQKDNNPNLKIKLKQILRGYLNNDTSSIRRYADFIDTPTQEDVVEFDLDNSFYHTGTTLEQSASTRKIKNENNVKDIISLKIDTVESYKSLIKKVNGTERLSNESQGGPSIVENGANTTHSTDEANNCEDINFQNNNSITVRNKLKTTVKKFKRNKNCPKNLHNTKFSGDTRRNLKLKKVNKVNNPFICSPSDDDNKSDKNIYSSSDDDDKFDKNGKLASKILKRLPKAQKRNANYSADISISNTSDVDFNVDVMSSPSVTALRESFNEDNLTLVIEEVENFVVPEKNSIDINPVEVPIENIKDIECFFASRGTKKMNQYHHGTLYQNHKNIVDFFRNKSLRVDAEIFPAIISSNSSKCNDHNVTPKIENSDVTIITKTECSSLDDMDIENADINIPPRFYRIKKGCIVILHHPSKLFFHGKLKATILCGQVEIFGYKLTNQPCHIYASQCSCCLYFETYPYDTSTYGLFSKLTAIGLPVIQTEEIVTSLLACDSVIYLEELHDCTVDFIVNNFNSYPLFHTSSSEFQDVFEVPRDILQCAMYKYKPVRSFQDNSMWAQITNHALGSNSKTLICGGKDVGKSTLMRYCVNKLLARSSVAVIDLDPGQCEFTICGNISVTIVNKPLLGLNFTHLQEPKRIFNIGIINVTNGIEKYINALRDIVIFCKEDKEISALPWIINTMGMTDSLGLELIAYIVILFEPTIFVQMECNVPKRNFSMAITPHNLQVFSKNIKTNFNSTAWLNDTISNRAFSYYYYLVKQEKHGNKNKQAKEQRYLNLLAYFGQISISGFLNDVKPYMVPIGSIKIGLNVKLDELYEKVINGKVVALCFDDNPRHKLGSIFNFGVEPLLCYGHGLIRGIDNKSGQMYIITPLSVKKLQLVNTVVYSDILPDLALNNACYKLDTFVPYYANLIRKSRYRQLMNSPKRRFNPLQLLNIKKGS